MTARRALYGQHDLHLAPKAGQASECKGPVNAPAERIARQDVCPCIVDHQVWLERSKRMI